MPTDSFTDALERLDPASRALLDLSLRRGMRTEEIAEVLGADPDSVAASRDEALRRVAEAVGMAGDHQVDEVRARLAELPAEEWLGGVATNGTSAAPAEAEADAEQEEGAAETPAGERVNTTPAEPQPTPVALIRPAEEAEAEPEGLAATATPAERPRRRRALPVLLSLVVVAGVIVAIALGSSSDSTRKPAASAPQTPPPASQPKPVKPKPTPPNPLATISGVGGASASGTARIVHDRIVLDVKGLPNPRGHYEVWLYNSLIDAVSLGTSSSGHIKLDSKLPKDWKRFQFVDISLEPNDGNVSHSGQSVARVPVGRLAR